MQANSSCEGTNVKSTRQSEMLFLLIVRENGESVQILQVIFQESSLFHLWEVVPQREYFAVK